MTKILSFDMGLRNLAYCIADVSGSAFTICDWNNYDLLSGTDSQTATRCNCGGVASWLDISGSKWCKKCVKTNKTLLKGLPTDVVFNVKALKEFCENKIFLGFTFHSSSSHIILLYTLVYYIQNKI
jgi:hypothetical protein